VKRASRNRLKPSSIVAESARVPTTRESPLAEKCRERVAHTGGLHPAPSNEPSLQRRATAPDGMGEFMEVRSLRDFVDKHGVRAAAHDLACRAANALTGAMVLQGMSLTVDSVPTAFLKDEAGLRWGFLDQDVLLRALPHGAADDMDERFIVEALERGDRCYGALAGDLLASYGWYSTRPTPVNRELLLRFDRRYAYMYKGYTLPAYRGRRLHGIGMARALKAHVGGGLKGLVSYVRSNNVASLKSCHRLGYKDFGRIFVVELRGRYRTYATSGCARYGFCVEPLLR
jgi:hypothetical protein